MSRFNNAELAIFPGVGKYDVPEILPTYELPKVRDIVEFDFCLKLHKDRDDLAVHFFREDYKFERVWTGPDRYAEMLKNYSYILGPDFSQYVDFPKAVNIYNHYRNNWLCRYWQEVYEITVVPTVLWGLEDSYEYCFDGYPKHSIVAVSNVGVSKSQSLHQMFLSGYEEMMKRLEPSLVLVYTRNREPLSGNVQYIDWRITKGLKDIGNRSFYF